MMTRWRKFLLVSIAFLVVAGFAGTLVLVSGIMPIKASSRHWAITAWLLDFAKHRSVATHTIGLEAPPLEEEWKVLKGAMQYERVCQPCHGNPEVRSPGITQFMTPRPPYLPPRISRWEPAGLFYIVKHGIKFTGMPAWPTQQRDDEVWAMVAFLQRFPDLDADEYRALVTGEGRSPAAPVGVDRCTGCHGWEGNGTGSSAFPRLRGQSSTYLYLALRAFARGERHSGIMGPIAAGLDDGVMRALAESFGTTAPTEPFAPVTALSSRGAEIALQGIPGQQVPACLECHGRMGPRNPAYPRLAGLSAEYLALQLELFAEDRRGGSPYAHIMRPIAGKLTREQRTNVAEYFASLPARD